MVGVWLLHWKIKELIVIPTFSLAYNLVALIGLMFQLFYYMLFGRIIFSFIRLGRDANPTLLSVRQFINLVTEPVLSPIRKLIPPLHLGNGAYFDLSALILIILLPYLERLMIRLVLLIF